MFAVTFKTQVCKDTMLLMNLHCYNHCSDTFKTPHAYTVDSKVIVNGILMNHLLLHSSAQ